MRDSSLDDFLDGGDAGDADSGGSEETDDATADGEVEAPESKGTDLPDSDEATGEGTVEGESESTTPADDGADDEPADDAPTDVEPAVPTYDWTPGGAACEGCGTVVERRWQDDAGLVCDDCKAW